MDNLFNKIYNIAEQTELTIILVFVLIGLLVICCFTIYDNNSKIKHLKEQNEKIIEELKKINTKLQ